MVGILHRLLVRHGSTDLIPSDYNPIVIEYEVRIEARGLPKPFDNFLNFVYLVRLGSNADAEGCEYIRGGTA